MRITASSRILLVSVLAASALSTGCAFGQARTPAPKSAASASAEAALADFTPDERARILAVQDTVERAASEHGLDPSLVNAIIWVESRFDPDAESPAGARGLMQLMPATAAYLAKRLGESRPRANDPEFNVRAGSLYLAEMVEKFDDERNAVAAYHAGPGNVAKWLAAGKRFPDWSNEYVDKVMAARVRFEGLPRGRSRMAAVEPETPVALAVDEPSEAPDPDTLPSADEVRALVAAGELEPELATAPTPTRTPEPELEPEPPSEPSPPPRVTATLELEDAADGFALVFEAHPEADANPHAGPPPGWPRKPAPAAPPSKAAARKPAPTPKPAAQPKPVVATRDEDEALGIGVLPDL